MEAYAYILYRLALFLGRVSPELVAAGLFAVPGLVGFLAGLPYVLDLLAGWFVCWWVGRIFNAHIWYDVPPEHQRLLVRLRDRILLMPLDRDPLLWDHRVKSETSKKINVTAHSTDGSRGTISRIDEGGVPMVDAHEAAKYVESRTKLADEVLVTAQGERSATLKGVHKRADGSEIEVNIDIRDNGPRAKDHRYEVDVSADGVETIRANPSESLRDALSNADSHSSGMG